MVQVGQLRHKICERVAQALLGNKGMPHSGKEVLHLILQCTVKPGVDAMCMSVRRGIPSARKGI
jgi:hypothetical protein